MSTSRRLSHFRSLVLQSSIITALSTGAIYAQDTFAIAGQNIPADRVQLRTLDSHIPFRVPGDKAEWLTRRESLVRQLKVALGLDPMPPLVPLAPIVHGELKQDGFEVRKVIVESLPGLYLTGSLFLPEELSTTTKRPAILCPHGHWDNGRMYRATDDEVARQLATGAERFESAARNPIQARCVQLARMGFVVFLYDMLGYADSIQLDMDRTHRWGINHVNPQDDSSDQLLFSARAEMYGQSVLGLQTVHGFRAFEFLKSLDYVDATKIAITGASGGGTQSFLAAALNDELIGAFPAVMVSTGMQGGCTCENASLLRLNTGNVEIAALIAPRPLGMTSADDWTVNMERDGFPELKQLYAMYDAKDRVQLFPATHFPHNYNHVSRVAMYGWFNRLYGLGLKEPILESDFDYLEPNALTVWDDAHPKPASGLVVEREIVGKWQTHLDHALQPADGGVATADTLRHLKDGWLTLTDGAEAWKDGWNIRYEWRLDQSQPKIIFTNAAGQSIATGICEATDVIERGSNGSFKIDWRKVRQISLSLDAADAVASDGDGQLNIRWQLRDPLVEAGESDQQPLVPNPRPAAAYTYGYNAPAIIRKLGVLLAVVDHLHSKTTVKTQLATQGSSNVLALSAMLRRPGYLEALRLDDQEGFRFGNVTSIRDVNFMPSALRYQDVYGLFVAANDPEVSLTVVHPGKDQSPAWLPTFHTFGNVSIEE